VPRTINYLLLVKNLFHIQFLWASKWHEFAVPDSSGSWASCLGSPESPAKAKNNIECTLLVIIGFTVFERQKKQYLATLHLGIAVTGYIFCLATKAALLD
jgi:hypothetical protein